MGSGSGAANNSPTTAVASTLDVTSAAVRRRGISHTNAIAPRTDRHSAASRPNRAGAWRSEKIGIVRRKKAYNPASGPNEAQNASISVSR